MSMEYSLSGGEWYRRSLRVQVEALTLGANVDESMFLHTLLFAFDEANEMRKLAKFLFTPHQSLFTFPSKNAL